MRFDSFAGNEYLKKNLLLAAKTNNLMNSYIFVGDEGIGKKTLVNIFVNAVLCENTDENGACGQCSACRQFVSNNHPDVFYLTKANDKKTIGINEVREQIIKNVYIKPFSGAKKIFVTEEGDLLTPEAQNALLKVLEEPPEYVVFITLVKKLDVLLDTVRSRSSVMRLHPVAKETVQSYLKKEGAADDLCSFCADFSQGIIGKGKKMLKDEEYREMFYSVSDILCDVFSGVSPVGLRSFLTDNKEKIDMIIEFMLVFARDCLMRCEHMDKFVICKKNIEKLGTYVYDKRKFVKFADSVAEYKKRLDMNVNFSIATLEFMTELS